MTSAVQEIKNCNVPRDITRAPLLLAGNPQISLILEDVPVYIKYNAMLGYSL